MATKEFIAFPLPRNPTFHDLTGQRFGRLVALEPYRCGKVTHWRCKCDCGKETMPKAPNLIDGVAKSCGCLQRETAAKGKTTHGGTGTKTYKIWSGMRQRCDNPTHKRYPRYGGRGIIYDPRWADYANFLADMGEVPDGLQIDRINNNGNYCKENCRWVPRSVNDNNHSRNVNVEFRGQRLTAMQLARLCGVPYSTLLRRLHMGWDAERVVAASAKLSSAPR